MRCASLGLLCLGLAVSIGSSAPAAQAPQTPAAQAPQTPPPAKPTPAPTTSRGRQSAPPTAAHLTLTVMVTGIDGRTIPDAAVKAIGPVDREASSDPSGLVTLNNLSPGTYRVRFEHPAFITLEKEISIAAGKPLRASATLSAAPPPPPPKAEAPPTPPPATPAPAGSYSPNVVDIPDLFEKNFIGNAAIKRSPIGCTASSTSTLVQLRDPVADHAHADADELIYIVAGEGTHKIGGKEQSLSGGVFTIIPRGTTHSLTRRGRQPLVIISTLSGPPCQPGQ